MQSFQKILVPVDFEELSSEAINVAMTVGAKFESSITLFHAYSLPVAPYAEGFTWPMGEFAAAARAALDKALMLARPRYPQIDAALAAGPPAYEIIDFVKKQAIDLVVMGTHGRRGVSRFLLGSVAEKVVRLSPVPVLTVPGVA